MSTFTIPDRVRRAINPALRGVFGLQARVLGSRVALDPTSAPLPDGPVLFAANHTNSEDIPRLAMALRRPFYVVAATDGMFGAVNKVACTLLGTVWLERTGTPQARASRRAAHAKAVATLRRGYDVLIFPEAVWMPRLYWADGRPMLPFFRGAVTIAREAGAPLVPIVTEFTPDRVCHVHIGEPFEYGPYADDTLATHALRCQMAATKQALRNGCGGMTEETYLAMRARWRKAYPQWDPDREMTFVRGYRADPAGVSAWFQGADPQPAHPARAAHAVLA